jgi:hypothetical protein
MDICNEKRQTGRSLSVLTPFACRSIRRTACVYGRGKPRTCFDYGTLATAPDETWRLWQT